MVMNPVVWLLLTLIDLTFWAVVISAILSWFVAFDVINTRNRFVATALHALNRLTEPLYRPIRKIIPNFGGIDLSPIVLLIGLQFLQRVILYAFYG